MIKPEKSHLLYISGCFFRFNHRFVAFRKKKELEIFFIVDDLINSLS